MEGQKEKVLELLNSYGIEYKNVEHEAVFTVEEAKKIRPQEAATHCKNLFLRDKKNKKYYLVSMQEDKKADLKNLAGQLGTGPLSFANEEELYNILNLTPGGVTPFGIINDEERRVTVVLDNEFDNSGYITFHPNVNTATLILKYSDFIKFLEIRGNKIEYIKI